MKSENPSFEALKSFGRLNLHWALICWMAIAISKMSNLSALLMQGALCLGNHQLKSLTSNFIKSPSENLTLLIFFFWTHFLTFDGMRTFLGNTMSFMLVLNKMFLTLTPKFSSSERLCQEEVTDYWKKKKKRSNFTRSNAFCVSTLC